MQCICRKCAKDFNFPCENENWKCLHDDLRETMEWINVNEKIPPYNRIVLAYDTQRIYLAFRLIEDEYNEHWAICEDRDCSCIGCTGAITHWMPLPEPPKDV